MREELCACSLALRRLTFDYKYEVGDKQLECHCGAPSCRKYLY